MDFFETVAFPWVVGEEGNLSLDPRDRGNWTGGAVGVGQLKGTKYGVSAAAFPTVDIANLTIQQAQQIAYHKYWYPAGCSGLPDAIALCLFDFAYNAGVHEGVKVLQRALGFEPIDTDGVFGPKTQQAAADQDSRIVVQNFTQARINAYQQMPEFSIEGAGWTARARATEQRALSL